MIGPPDPGHAGFEFTERVAKPRTRGPHKNGFLHLKIAKTPAGWSSAEVDLSRSLGYGSYRFVVGDIGS